MKVSTSQNPQSAPSQTEKGAALATAIIIMALIMAISIGVLAIANTETSIMASDLRRTQTFYVATASIEYMTNNFNALFARTANPSETDLTNLKNNKPQSLEAQGYKVYQDIKEDTDRLDEIRAKLGTPSNQYPTKTIQKGVLAGLYGTVTPYLLTSIATHSATNTTVTVQREMNSYKVPLFQFGIFGSNDIEFHPGPRFTFNGRVHSNRNLYLAGGDGSTSSGLYLEDRVTSGNELVYDVDRNGNLDRTRTVNIKVGNTFYPLTAGSVVKGPNYSTVVKTPGYFPDSPNGTPSNNWKLSSKTAPQSGSSNQFNEQVLTRSTGATELKLPLEQGGAPTRELIKRPMPGENSELSNSRYYNKAQIRILIDDENITGENAGGIGGGGVELSSFNPVALPFGSADENKNALLPVDSNGLYLSSVKFKQGNCNDWAKIVRAVKSSSTSNTSSGAGIRGRIKIEIVDAGGTVRDVTTQILSMGMTVGEPNAIVQLQRPLWAAFIPGSRERSAGKTNLVDLINHPNTIVNDGQLKDFAASSDFDSAGSINIPAIPANDLDDTLNRCRPENPNAIGMYNQIVPINVYNVREGWSAGFPDDADNVNRVNARGITSVVELNMQNLSRWVSGYYDNNLLNGTFNGISALGKSIDSTNGFVIYVSDRRGDSLKNEYTVYDTNGNPDTTSKKMTTNGIVDNEDIYSTNFNFPNLDNGEDVINFGVNPDTKLPYKGYLQNIKSELPNPGESYFEHLSSSSVETRRTKAINSVPGLKYKTDYFRRAVRLFDGDDLIPDFAPARLSTENGITVASENMVYIWGSYNTTGIKNVPANGASLNPNDYLGDQVPASIVCDAFFPLSRTWFDALSMLYPDGTNREADANPSTGMSQETSVRAGIIAGSTMSAMAATAGQPDQFSGTNRESRLSGGVHNFPRFLERWNNKRWNYSGSLILLYYSNQAMGPYNSNGIIYSPPIRNWSFDVTYRDPKRLPPGTPFFQYIEPTGFRQLIDPNATPTPTTTP